LWYNLHKHHRAGNTPRDVFLWQSYRKPTGNRHNYYIQPALNESEKEYIILVTKGRKMQDFTRVAAKT